MRKRLLACLMSVSMVFTLMYGSAVAAEGGGQEKIEEAQEKQDDVIHQAKHYILKHIQENIYVEEIADEVHLNAQYLMRLFRKETGFSILEYITEERIKLAKQLLIQTDYPINRVADNVGYGNYSYFTKIFKKNVGQAPAAFRSERKNNIEEYK